ncbi:hypothetical protein ABDK56_11900 [Sphingomonas sp. ASV193]|uniref:hypothetical protein n=1 Tax=Sphingomonas sp. ASV193 TaxID=3144405 RepID=UPI0032E86B20
MDRAISLEARRIDLSIEPPFRLGPVEVCPSAHEIAWQGGRRRIQPQVLKVLVALHDKVGCVVSRDEIVDRCWDGRFVGDDVINRSVLLLRRLGAECGGIKIETIPRGGYRLLESSVLPSVSTGSLPRWKSWAAVLVIVMIVGFVSGERLFRAKRVAAAPELGPLKIELIPFDTETNDRKLRTLAAATQDAIANTLAYGAYSVSVADPAKASRPSADFLVTGHLNEVGGSVIASVRMVETSHQTVVFAHQFVSKLSAADSLPQMAGGQLAAKISWTAPLVGLERRHPSDPAIARQLFEQAATGLADAGNLSDFENSRRLARAAPNSALAQLTFAYAAAFVLEELSPSDRATAVREARLASARVEALAPESGESYAPWCLLHSETLFADCERRLEKARQIDPDAPFASWFLADIVLNPVGRNVEAAELARLSLARDPYMVNKIGLALQLMEATGQSKDADRLYQSSLKWWPQNPWIRWDRFVGMIQAGHFAEASRFNDQNHVENGSASILHAITENNLTDMRKACEAARGLASHICMTSLAQRGQYDAAYTLAYRLYPTRSGQSQAQVDWSWLSNPNPTPVAFLTSRAAAPLRRDPRFLTLAKNLGLLAYWRGGKMPDFCVRDHEEECLKIQHD